jgi:RNA polymerase sigma factor (sigma-70 family)
MECINDNRILAGIRDCDEKVVAAVYSECFMSIRHLVTYNHGTPDDAKDLFQDAMVIVCERLQAGNLELSCSFNTFLYSIARNLWFRRLAARGKTIHLDREIPDDSLSPVRQQKVSVSIQEEKMAMIQRHYDTLTERCKKIIRLMLKRSSTEQIMKAMGFSSVAYTRKRKYQCKHSLIKRIKSDPDYQRLKEDEDNA